VRLSVLPLGCLDQQWTNERSKMRNEQKPQAHDCFDANVFSAGLLLKCALAHVDNKALRVHLCRATCSRLASSHTLSRLSCCVDCGPGSFVLGNVDHFQAGCDRSILQGKYTTRELCDSACRANFAYLCVFSPTSCSIFNEVSPGNCDTPVETVSDYQRWTVCNGTSAPLQHV
jgi:hypothetical protein